jgi:hypothetical protein
VGTPLLVLQEKVTFSDVELLLQALTLSTSADAVRSAIADWSFIGVNLQESVNLAVTFLSGGVFGNMQIVKKIFSV